jgi:hypothetical protein
MMNKSVPGEGFATRGLDRKDEAVAWFIGNS